MPLSREFKELYVERAQKDPEFRRGLLIEAINLILNNETTAGRFMLRDYINATGIKAVVCAQLKMKPSQLSYVLGPKGNPTLDTFFPIVKACAKREKVRFSVCEGRCAI